MLTPPQSLPKTRRRKLSRASSGNGHDYALIRDTEIAVSVNARDFLKDFIAYVGADGRSSRAKANIYVALTRQINRILGIRSVQSLDEALDYEHLAKLALAWTKVQPVLTAGMQARLPRKECFKQLWEKFEEIARI